MNTWARLLLACCVLLVTVAPLDARPGVSFTLTRVAAITLDGQGERDCAGVHGSAAGLNEAGAVAGGYASSAKRMAPYIAVEGERTRLESGHGGGVALGINDAGDVVGAVFDTARTDPCQYPGAAQPAIWRDETLQLLPLPEGAIGGAAWALDNAGRVAGAIDLITGSTLPAFWHDGEIELLVLPALPGGPATGGEAYGISGLGVIAGRVERFPLDGLLEMQAVTWSNRIAQPLPGLGGVSVNRAWAVNDAGVAVGASCLAGSNLAVATTWQNGHVVAMPALPGTIESEARSINNAGEVVGFAWFEKGRTAVLWQNGEAIDLNEAVTNLDGLHLIRADAINEAGVIAAVAEDEDGYRFAVLLTESS